MLYIVATPIGNLEDITLRALQTLKEVDFIACEDTRHTKILLDRYKIQKPLISYHQHTKVQKIDYLISLLRKGKNIALVCDAGTPGIDDPGSVIIAKAYKEKIKIVPIPGPSSLSVALSVCGFLTQRFLFLGFLPKKKGRQTLLKNIKSSAENIDAKIIVLFESPYRILKTFTDLKNYLGDCEVTVCRELTKKFEEIFRGRLSDAILRYTVQKPKGEFTIIIKLDN
ncbi:MAG: 16S rRNA (cytidine(1402)-2'-O)-methyltransferase [Patescibacteria group bacterium]